MLRLFDDVLPPGYLCEQLIDQFSNIANKKTGTEMVLQSSLR